MTKTDIPTVAIVSLTDVTLRYENGTQALEDVTLDVHAGEHLCVLGANGSGKSTLASVICGLLAPDEGAVELLGEVVFDASRKDPIDFDAYRRTRQRLGLVFQNPDDQMVTTVVEEDVAFGPENLGVPPHEIGRRVERELRRVAMEPFAKADPTRLSGGQKQRVAIAGALAMEPAVLVLDEPGSLLDVRGRSAIMRVMGRLRADGTTIVHITHYMEEALQADRVVVLDHGRIVLEGTPKDVFAHTSEIVTLGLEEPFAAKVSSRLGLPWTCSEDELLRMIAGQCGKARPAARTSAPTPAPAPHKTYAARAEHVSFSYQHESKALDDVTFGIEQGSSVAIVGHTGSGKSTLVRLLCALEAPDTGEVLVGNVCTRRKKDRRRIQGTIGYVMQHPERQLFAETVMQDVAFGPKNMGLSAQEVQTRCRHALDLVGLVGLDDASPFELSGGQQRLCAIAGVLAMEPRIIVLDEPTAGLDPRGRTELREILANVHRLGVTTVEVTHSMDDAALADKVVVLDEARLVLADTPSNVFCASNANMLRKSGLGLPTALEWALELDLGCQPLTLDELVGALVSQKAG